jgi:hypothetical protein
MNFTHHDLIFEKDHIEDQKQKQIYLSDDFKTLDIANTLHKVKYRSHYQATSINPIKEEGLSKIHSTFQDFLSIRKRILVASITLSL